MDNRFTEMCKTLGISPSITRKKIYEYLEHSKDHPTADEIYKNLIDVLPTLSKTTVYNVLSLFLQHNLISVINTDNNEKRYEIFDESHSHFVCKICSTIYDVPKANVSYSRAQMPGFEIDREEITFIGICPDCIAIKNN